MMGVLKKPALAYNAIVGIGAGSSSAAVLDLRAGKLFRAKTYTTKSSFSEQLNNAIHLMLAEEAQPVSYVIEHASDHLRPGDYILHETDVSRVKRITYDADGTMSIESGRQLISMEEALKARATLLQDVLNASGSLSGGWSASFSDNITDAFPVLRKFLPPTELIDPNLECRFYLTMHIDWYTSSVMYVDPESHQHGGYTDYYIQTHGDVANHDGYVHVADAGIHDHGVEITLGDCLDSDDAYEADDSDWAFRTPVTPAHSSIAASIHNHDTEEGAQTTDPATISHDHNDVSLASDPADLVSVALYEHDHPKTLTVVSDEGDHYHDGHTCKHRGGSGPHPSDGFGIISDGVSITTIHNIMEIAESGVPLTFVIQVNDVEIEGSPFTGKTIGDSIEDLDITQYMDLDDYNYIYVFAEGTGMAAYCSIECQVSAIYALQELI